MENWSTIVVVVLIAIAFVAVIVRGILRKKAGKSGCSGCCDSCAGSSLCHKEES